MPYAEEDIRDYVVDNWRFFGPDGLEWIRASERIRYYTENQNDFALDLTAVEAMQKAEDERLHGQKIADSLRHAIEGEHDDDTRRSIHYFLDGNAAYRPLVWWLAYVLEWRIDHPHCWRKTCGGPGKPPTKNPRRGNRHSQPEGESGK